MDLAVCWDLYWIHVYAEVDDDGGAVVVVEVPVCGRTKSPCNWPCRPPDECTSSVDGDVFPRYPSLNK